MIHANTKGNKKHDAKDGVVGNGEGQVKRHLLYLNQKKVNYQIETSALVKKLCKMYRRTSANSRPVCLGNVHKWCPTIFDPPPSLNVRFLPSNVWFFGNPESRISEPMYGTAQISLPGGIGLNSKYFLNESDPTLWPEFLNFVQKYEAFFHSFRHC